MSGVFTKIVNLRIGEGVVASKPEKLEPGTVTLNKRPEKTQSPIGRMNIARPKFGRQAVAFAGEANRGWKQFFLKWPL